MAKLKHVFLSYDKVKLYEGDNFYFLDSFIDNDKKRKYIIKFWDSKVMASFSENKIYLKGRIKFSSKEVIKKYIIRKNLVVTNFNLIFVE
jgi:hypothetical protein